LRQFIAARARPTACEPVLTALGQPPARFAVVIHHSDHGCQGGIMGCQGEIMASIVAVAGTTSVGATGKLSAVLDIDCGRSLK